MRSLNTIQSVSIDQFLKAGKLIKPVSKTKTVLYLESFDITQKEWVTEKSTTIFIEGEQFSLGAFQNAFKGGPESGIKWVVKIYNKNARHTIVVTLGSSIKAHERKQLQMHTVASILQRNFQ